jgi:Skp family chaperone for outer membrane proteins
MIAKRTFVGLALVVALVAAGAAHAQGSKVAVFDPQRVSEETAEGKQIKARLEAFQAQKQGELDALQDEVRAMRKQLGEQALSLSADRKAQLEKDIQRKLVELQGAEEAASREFQLEISEAQQRFQLQLLQVVDAFGRDEGFDLILDLGTVAYASPATDVTTAIVDRFDATFPVDGAAAAAAGGS